MPSITNQIVVATEHLHLVADALRWAGLEPAESRRLERLGLSLVDLNASATRLEAAAAELRKEVLEDERTELHDPYERGLDPLLASLRDRFRHRHAGWTPTMGKNRLMGGIELLPYASVVKGFDLPHPVDRPAEVEEGRPSWAGKEPAPVRRVRVGVIDVRLAPHRRLEGGYLADPDGLDLPRAGIVRQGWQGHATFVANVVLTEAPSAELLIRTALEEVQEVDPKRPDDRWRMPLWRFAERLVEFADAGVQVLNCSMGCETFDGQPPLVLERAIALLSPTMAIVAAAGNHGLPGMTTTPYDVAEPRDAKAALFPAALDGVVAVGAREPDGSVAEFNPKGAADDEWAPWIDGFCPGRDVISAYLGDGTEEVVELPPAAGGKGPDHVAFRGWARWTGSSFAAARATGRIAALIAGGMSPGGALAELRGDPDFTGR